MHEIQLFAAQMKSLIQDINQIISHVENKSTQFSNNSELFETMQEIKEMLTDLQLSMLSSPVTGRMFVPPPMPPATEVDGSFRQQLNLWL